MGITEHQFRSLLDRYLKGNATEEEIRTLNNFFDSYQKESAFYNDFDPEIKEEIYQRVKRRLSFQPREKQNVRFRWLKAAAAISIISVFFYFLYTSTTDRKISTPEVNLVSEQTFRGEKSIFQLPDGTRVHLNSNTTLSYPENFNEDAREVALSGEAYFEVFHNPSKPFQVRTATTIAQVLGTSFNVKLREDKVEVTLVEGKVRIASSTADVVLSPNQQAIVDTTSNKIITRHVKVEKFIGWKDNTLFFEETELEEVVRQLEIWYDVNISIKSPGIKKCHITAKYQNESLENVMRSLQFLLQADINMNDLKHISISGKSCK